MGKTLDNPVVRITAKFPGQKFRSLTQLTKVIKHYLEDSGAKAVTVEVITGGVDELFAAGRVAFGEGFGSNCCPRGLTPGGEKQWRQGWTAAYKEDLQRRQTL